MQSALQADWRASLRAAVRNSYDGACKQGQNAFACIKRHPYISSAVGLILVAGLGYGARRSHMGNPDQPLRGMPIVDGVQQVNPGAVGLPGVPLVPEYRRADNPAIPAYKKLVVLPFFQEAMRDFRLRPAGIRGIAGAPEIPLALEYRVVDNPRVRVESAEIDRAVEQKAQRAYETQPVEAFAVDYSASFLPKETAVCNPVPDAENSDHEFETPRSSPAGASDSPRLVTPLEDFPADPVSLLAEADEVLDRVRAFTRSVDDALAMPHPADMQNLVEHYAQWRAGYQAHRHDLTEKIRQIHHGFETAASEAMPEAAMRLRAENQHEILQRYAKECDDRVAALDALYAKGPWVRGAQTYRDILRGNFVCTHACQDDQRLDVFDMVWHLYEHAVRQDKKFVEGTFKVYDPRGTLYQTLLHCHDGVYERASSHAAVNHGLDIPSALRSEVFLPNNKYTLLLWRDDACGFTYIKPEDYGFDLKNEPIDFARHAGGWGASIYRRVFSPISNDAPEYRKERVPQNVVNAWLSLADAHGMAHAEAKGLAAHGIWPMIDAASGWQDAAMSAEQRRLFQAFFEAVDDAAGKDSVYGRMGREVDAPFIDALVPSEAELARWQALRHRVSDYHEEVNAGVAAADDSMLIADPGACVMREPAQAIGVAQDAQAQNDGARVQHDGFWGYVPQPLRWWQ